jgi:glucokinase
VIVDNHVLRGRKGMGGHVGHMSIAHDGVRCACGNMGCIEAYAAGPAFTARAKAVLGDDKISAADVFQLARAGQAKAQTLIEEEGNFLGQGFTSLLHLYSPDILIMGGGLSNEFEMLAPFFSRYIAGNAMAAFKDVPVVKAKLGGNSGLIGAACLVFDGGERY